MTDEKIELKYIDPVPRTAPRYPLWEVKETGLGFERRTVMTREEFELWRSQMFK